MIRKLYKRLEEPHPLHPKRAEIFVCFSPTQRRKLSQLLIGANGNYSVAEVELVGLRFFNKDRLIWNH